ncbi:hypothetical protein PTKIN_Ptkin08bG0015900 [Pterospermum kingtungense]
MALDLGDQFDEMSLDMTEGEVLEINNCDSHDRMGDIELCLMGCFLTDRAINFAAMRSPMAEIWHPLKGIFVKEINHAHCLFQFFHVMDLKRVLEGGKEAVYKNKTFPEKSGVLKAADGKPTVDLEELEVDPNDDRKRRRAGPNSEAEASLMDMDSVKSSKPVQETSSPVEPFLLVEPGSQACQKQLGCLIGIVVGLGNPRVEGSKARVGFTGCFSSNLVRRSGGVVLWNVFVLCSVCSYSRTHIELEVSDPDKDKREGADHPDYLYMGFRKVLVECDLHDLPLVVYPYTWERKVEGVVVIEE